MKINIVPYTDEWPLLFETIKKEIKIRYYPVNDVLNTSLNVKKLIYLETKNLISF